MLDITAWASELAMSSTSVSVSAANITTVRPIEEQEEDAILDLAIEYAINRQQAKTFSRHI